MTPLVFPLCLFSIGTYSLTKMKHVYFLKCHDLHASEPLHMLFSLCLNAHLTLARIKRYRGQRSRSSHFQALDFLLCHTAVFWFALCVTIPRLSPGT